MEWGCDTLLYSSIDQLRCELPKSLASGRVRVLKQYRGNGGNGVWKVELLSGDSLSKHEDIVRVRHAKRGSIDYIIYDDTKLIAFR